MPFQVSAPHVPRLTPLRSFSSLTIRLSRAIQQASLPVEPGAMAGAVVAVFIWIPFQPAAHMRAVWDHLTCPGRQKMFCQALYRMPSVNDHLFSSSHGKTPLGRKDICLRAVLPRNQVSENTGTHHCRGHSPFSKSRCHVPTRLSAGKTPDIWDLAQSHAILGRPMSDLSATRI